MIKKDELAYMRANSLKEEIVTKGAILRKP